MARTELPNGVILPAEYSDDWYEDMTSNLTKLDDVIGSDSEKLNADSVYFLRMSSAALTDSGTGNFSDLNSSYKIKTGDLVLDSGRKLYRIVSVDSTNETFSVGNLLFKVTAESDLAPVAESGDYDDLTDLPTYGITRLCSSAITDNSTVAFSAISSTNKIKVGDFLLDTKGKLYQISSVDTANETVSVTTPLTQLAVDANVMHLSGNETAAGIKTFSDDTFVKSLNFTKEVASPSSSNVAILPIIATITYSDQSPAQSSILNLRISADGSKTLYPNENGSYSLGLVSRNWDNVFSYMFEAFGKNIGNEFSNNARTNLYLKANRDTSGQSGVYISKFRQNRAQGEMGTLDVVQVSFDVLENSVRSNRLWYLNWFNWENDIPKNVEVRSLCEKVDYKLTHINDLNPGSLSLPDLDNGLDISGYITTGSSTNDSYTAPADGYLAIILASSSPCGLYVYDYSKGIFMRSNSITDSTYNNVCGVFMPILKNQTMNIASRVTDNIVSAKFYPCQGNV